MIIHEAKIEFCVVAEYMNGDSFSIAKFMHEEDARNYKRARQRRKKEYVEWKLYERRERNGEVQWLEIK